MPLRIYLDDDADYDIYIALLEQAGHTVLSPREIDQRGRDDRVHLDYASRNGYVLLTHNAKDYQEEHRLRLVHGKSHHGILAIYHERDVSKDVRPHDIVRAIANLEASNLPLGNQFINLNAWQ